MQAVCGVLISNNSEQFLGFFFQKLGVLAGLHIEANDRFCVGPAKVESPVVVFDREAIQVIDSSVRSEFGLNFGQYLFDIFDFTINFARARILANHLADKIG